MLLTQLEWGNAKSDAPNQFPQNANFQDSEVYNLKSVIQAATPAELKAKTDTGRYIVQYSPASDVTNHDTSTGQTLVQDATYVKGKDGEPRRWLTEDQIFAGAIATASGNDLGKLATVQGVQQMVIDSSVNQFTKIGTNGHIATGVYSSTPTGAEIDTATLIPTIDPDTIYFATVASGVTFEGEYFDALGFVVGRPSGDGSSVEWDKIDPFDGLSFSGTVTQGDGNGVTGDAVYNFVDGLISTANASISSLSSRMDTAEADILTKASAADLAVTNANVALKADQTALDATNTTVATKADQSALDATNTTVSTKADQTALDAANVLISNLDSSKANTINVANIVIQEGVNYIQATGELTLAAADYNASIEYPRESYISRTSAPYPIVGNYDYTDGSFKATFNTSVNMAGKTLILVGYSA